MTPARRCAYEVVRRVFEQGAYADRAFHACARGLSPRDRALAQTIAYGTVQRRATLDHVAEALMDRPVSRLEPAVRAALRVGLFQLLYTAGVAEHAAVSESVELVKRPSPAGSRLVNAVLRRATREAPGLVSELHDRDPRAAALLHSVPGWLAEKWWQELGPQDARALLARVNQPAESALRVNRLLSHPGAVGAELPVASHPAQHLPEGLVLEGAFDAHGSDLWRRGAIMPQSRASMLVARVLDPQPGELVADLCAAPGGKTTHLAALMQDRGAVAAVERHRGRARALELTAQRLHASSVRVVVQDAVAWRSAERVDRVLVDPPCSGLGTLQSRPDLRWRIEPEAIEELAHQQSAILAAAARALKPGGTLTYSVCTISAPESHRLLEGYLAEHPELEVDDLGARYPGWRDGADPRYLQLLPHRDLTDGFFIARLRRAAD